MEGRRGLTGATTPQDLSWLAEPGVKCRRLEDGWRLEALESGQVEVVLCFQVERAEFLEEALAHQCIGDLLEVEREVC